MNRGSSVCKLKNKFIIHTHTHKETKKEISQQCIKFQTNTNKFPCIGYHTSINKQLQYGN